MKAADGSRELGATVVIPTFNGQTYLPRLLDALRTQRYEPGFEVLVIDSGSTDATLEILERYPEIRLHRIPNTEFGHGRTRNLGAAMAKGRVVAFLTQDAIPRHDRWLAEIAAPLDLPGVRGVVGRQVPRPTCFPLLKYEIEGVFREQGPPGGVTLALRGETEPDPAAMGRLTFYSDVNAASLRAFLVDEIPYQDVPYAEDLAFGRDILMAGYAKAYAPQADVEHSNDMTLREYGLRIFEETVALRRVGADVGVFRLRHHLPRIVYGILVDGVRIIADREYTAGAKLKWLVLNPAYHAAKWRNFRRASRISLDDHAAIAKGSLEADRARRA